MHCECIYRDTVVLRFGVGGVVKFSITEGWFSVLIITKTISLKQ